MAVQNQIDTVDLFDFGTPNELRHDPEELGIQYPSTITDTIAVGYAVVPDEVELWNEFEDNVVEYTTRDGRMLHDNGLSQYLTKMHARPAISNRQLPGGTHAQIRSNTNRVIQTIFQDQVFGRKNLYLDDEAEMPTNACKCDLSIHHRDVPILDGSKFIMQYKAFRHLSKFPLEIPENKN